MLHVFAGMHDHGLGKIQVGVLNLWLRRVAGDGQEHGDLDHLLSITGPQPILADRSRLVGEVIGFVTHIPEPLKAPAPLNRDGDGRSHTWPAPHNQPLTWAAKHLFKAVGDLRQEVDDQTKGSGRKARADRRPLDGVTLIVKQTLNGWGNRLRTWPARE